MKILIDLYSLTLKELLIYNEKELYHKFAGYISQTNLIKTIAQVVKKFISDDLYQQRKTIIQLLIKHSIIFGIFTLRFIIF